MSTASNAAVSLSLKPKVFQPWKDIWSSWWPYSYGYMHAFCVWMCRPNNNLSVVLRSFPPFPWGRVSWRPGSVRAKAGWRLSPRDPPNVGIINTPWAALSSGCKWSGLRFLGLQGKPFIFIHCVLFPVPYYAHIILLVDQMTSLSAEQGSLCLKLNWELMTSWLCPQSPTSHTKAVAALMPKMWGHRYSPPEILPQLTIILSRASWGGLWVGVMSS